MTPWADPHSVADGILDDETYDWLGVFDVDAPLAAAGRRRARDGDRRGPTSSAPPTGIPVSATGTAGLAGLLTPDGAPDARRDGSPSSSPASTADAAESGASRVERPAAHRRTRPVA